MAGIYEQHSKGHLPALSNVHCGYCPFWLASAPAAGPLETGYAALNAHDYVKAYALLRPLADQGVPEAQYAIGSMYALGEGLPKDDLKGTEWTRLAAERGYAIAQLDLGMAYDLGIGVPKDSVQALKWFILAADNPLHLDERVRRQADSTRKNMSRDLPPDQVAEAKRLAAEWKPKTP